MKEYLDKSEIKFWMGIVTILGAMVAGFYTVKTDLTALSKDVEYIKIAVDQNYNRFQAVHTDNADQDKRLTKIETVLELN